MQLVYLSCATSSLKLAREFVCDVMTCHVKILTWTPCWELALAQIIWSSEQNDLYFDFAGKSFKFLMASQTQGIQQLLAAEKRAAEKVSEARKSKSNP